MVYCIYDFNQDCFNVQESQILQTNLVYMYNFMVLQSIAMLLGFPAGVCYSIQSNGTSHLALWLSHALLKVALHL